jgi:hypothetical protein
MVTIVVVSGPLEHTAITHLQVHAQWTCVTLSHITDVQQMWANARDASKAHHRTTSSLFATIYYQQ